MLIKNEILDVAVALPAVECPKVVIKGSSICKWSEMAMSDDV